MSVVIPDVAATYQLDELLDGLDTWYHLYAVPAVLGASTTLADLTESAWPGYAPIRVTTWSPALLIDGRAWSSADPALWTRGIGGVGGQVYGYYVTDGQTGSLIWCEARPGGPTPMLTSGDQVLVLPRLTLRQDPAPA